VSGRNITSSSSSSSSNPALPQGGAELQQAVLVALDLLTHLLAEPHLFAQARRQAVKVICPMPATALPAVADASDRHPSGVAPDIADGAGSLGRLCLMCLVAPEYLGFTAAEGAWQNDKLELLVPCDGVKPPDVGCVLTP
jgi:hypothetical protein